MLKERDRIDQKQQLNIKQITEPRFKISSEGIEYYLNSPTFAGAYHVGTKMQAKYAIACALIEDGRYKDPLYLLHNFIPPDNVELPLEDKIDIEFNGRELKKSLTLLLIEKGAIRSRSAEEKEAVASLGEELDADEAIKDLALGGVPLDVLGQLVTLEKFSPDLSDEKKLEELRSWTTHAMLRWYLGLLQGERPRHELAVNDIMDRIPEKIFKNPYALRYNLIAHYFEQKMMQSITDIGIEEGLKAAERLVETTDDSDKRMFIQGIYDRFCDVATFPLPALFKDKILRKGKEREFPSFEQRAFAYDFIHHGTRLLTADTGLGKTAAAFLAMENSVASKVLVLAPSFGKETWEIEQNAVFQNPNDVFIVKGSSDLTRAERSGKKYIVVSQELLGRAEEDSSLVPKLQSLIGNVCIDGAIIDEIDNFCNPNAISARTALSLLSLIRTNYLMKSGSDDAPVIGLTATPIRTDISDLNVPMAMLYPKRYASSWGESTERRKTFSDTHLNNPHLTYITLVGERRMFRWEKASDVQAFEYKPVPVSIHAFEDLLYEFINTQVGVDALTKIRLLEDALLNPLLVKAEVKTLVNGKIPEFDGNDLDKTLGILKRVVADWKHLREIDAPLNDDDYLNVDRLVELGFGDLALACFFSDLLENGIDTLIDEMTRDTQDPDLEELKIFWRPRELSSKYQRLRQMINEALTWKEGEDSVLKRSKIIIISPSKRQGRTGDVLQRTIEEDGKFRNLYANYELDWINDSKLITLIRRWTKGLCNPEDILLIDGSIPLGKKRDAVINRFVNDPNAAVLCVTEQSTCQSRDFTLNNLIDEQGREIADIKNMYLHWSWYFRRLRQMVGRSLRLGHLVPVDTDILEAINTLDQGKGEVVHYTELLHRIALTGATLHPEDQEFFDSKKVGKHIQLRSFEARFLYEAFAKLKGAGEDDTERFMEEISPKQEKNNYQLFAERFFDEGRDEYKRTGYNAELVASLVKRFNFTDGTILSLGAGTLLFQRKIRRGIDNVDINPYMMQAGWKLAQEFGGKMIQARASGLNSHEFPDGFYDCIDSAFALDWSKLGDVQKNDIEDSERVAILNQINRVLKPGGSFMLTLPEGAFNSETFGTFVSALESHFGFTIDPDYSGESYGISKNGFKKRLGWCIVALKNSGINIENLNLRDISFLYDRTFWVSELPKEEKNGKSNGRVNMDPSPDLRVKFEHYGIVNPLGAKLSIVEDMAADIRETKHSDVDAEKKDEIPVFDSRMVFLRGNTKEDYESYRKVVRLVIKDTSLTWQEAEKYCLDLLQKMISKGKNPENRQKALEWIEKELKRKQKNERR